MKPEICPHSRVTKCKFLLGAKPSNQMLSPRKEHELHQFVSHRYISQLCPRCAYFSSKTSCGGGGASCGESVGGATGSPTWFPPTGSPTTTPPVAASQSRVPLSKLLNRVKMWRPARLSVALSVVILQLLASSTHARPQTEHEVLFWIQIRNCNCILLQLQTDIEMHGSSGWFR